jgi:hypothetical protein
MAVTRDGDPVDARRRRSGGVKGSGDFPEQHGLVGRPPRRCWISHLPRRRRVELIAGRRRPLVPSTPRSEPVLDPDDEVAAPVFIAPGVVRRVPQRRRALDLPRGCPLAVGAAATLPTQRVDLRPGRGDTTEGQEAGRRIGGGAGANDLADVGGDARHSLETVLFCETDSSLPFLHM